MVCQFYLCKIKRIFSSNPDHFLIINNTFIPIQPQEICNIAISREDNDFTAYTKFITFFSVFILISSILVKFFLQHWT